MEVAALYSFTLRLGSSNKVLDVVVVLKVWHALDGRGAVVFDEQARMKSTWWENWWTHSMYVVIFWTWQLQYSTVDMDGLYWIVT